MRLDNCPGCKADKMGTTLVLCGAFRKSSDHFKCGSVVVHDGGEFRETFTCLRNQRALSDAVVSAAKKVMGHLATYAEDVSACRVQECLKDFYAAIAAQRKTVYVGEVTFCLDCEEINVPTDEFGGKLEHAEDWRGYRCGGGVIEADAVIMAEDERKTTR